MAALSMPAIVGLLALSVDTGVKAAASAQLRTATDAAALAGAAALATNNRLKLNYTNLSPEITAARKAAKALGEANRVLNDPVRFVDDQIVVGYLDPKDQTSTNVNTGVSASEFNSVQVNGLMDAAHGGQVPAFFARIFGVTGSDLRTTSIATAQNYRISGFRSPNGQNANLLPIVLDKTTYQNMIAGATTDEYTYVPGQPEGPSSAKTGGDGIPESRAYPVKTGNPGNWGTIKVGVNNNSTSTLGAQIRYGITPQQLATFPNSTISLDSLDSSTNPPTPYRIFDGNPGISAGIKDDLTAIIGRPVSLPIYDKSGGNGNNAWYRVIAFGPVRIVAVNFQGNPKYVIVQPSLIKDPTALPSAQPAASWTEGGLVRLYLSR
jgi:Flp pilus assembly protein TadG